MEPQNSLTSGGLCSEHLLWVVTVLSPARDAGAQLPAGANLAEMGGKLAASQVCPLCPDAPSLLLQPLASL